MFFVKKFQKMDKSLVDTIFIIKYTLTKERNKKEVDKHECIIGKNK